MGLEFIRKDNENIIDYMIRLYENRVQYELSNQDVASLLNKEDETAFDESRWRKIYQAWDNYFRNYVEEKFGSAEEYSRAILDDAEMQRIEIRKATAQMRDQKREYEAMIRKMGRFEYLRDVLIENVESLPASYDSLDAAEVGEHEIVVLLSDWHVGAEHIGKFNSYNTDIFLERLQTLIRKIKRYVQKNPTRKIHIANLGDLISGVIHVSTKIQSDENVVAQIKIATEALAQLISELASTGSQIEVYNVIGNHGRISPNKDATASIGENFEKLIPWYLELRLAEFENVNIHEDEDGIVEATVNGLDFIFAHGDFDKKNNVSKLPQLLGYVPDYVCLGHTHSQFTQTHGKTKVVVNPAMVGLDDYATQGRFGNQVAQTIINIERTYEGTDDEIKMLSL